ncbi:MAG: response regulator [Nannocystaceae bacterium]|nr:response regulator transcription factor [bacterium]
MSDPIRVVLVEDHQIVREGLRALLDGQDDIEVVGEADNGKDGVALVQQHQPDVVVMDLNMPELGGVEATKIIRKDVPKTQVLILSMYSTGEHVRPAIRAGAGGYLLKGSGLSDLVSAIQAVASGNAFFSPEVAKIVLDDSRGVSGPRAGSDLTPRERQVLKLVAEGKSSPEIAKDLGLSVKTIEGHRGRLMAKLETKNVAGMVRHAIRMGLVTA